MPTMIMTVNAVVLRLLLFPYTTYGRCHMEVQHRYIITRAVPSTFFIITHMMNADILR